MTIDQPRHVWGERALQLFALTSLAISSPLLNILKDGPEFFVNRRVLPLDIVSLAAILALVPPAVLFCVELASRVFGAGMPRFIHPVFVGLLVSLIVVPVLRALSLSGELICVLGILIGCATSIVVARFQLVRAWLSWLSLLSLFAIGAFFSSEGVRTLVLPPTVRQEVGFTETSSTPVVMLVFDEFPLNGLLNRELQIDAERFPNFAALARDSTWFRNAAAVNQFTPVALPSILSGRMPRSLKQLPTVESYPTNLFTILGRSHSITSYEPFTRLCPDDLCRGKKLSTTWLSRTKFMLLDLAAVYLNYLVPEDLDVGVPNIDGKWGDFWEETSTDWDAPNFNRGDRVESFKRFIRNLKPPGDKPPFIFAHIILPHMPHQFVPSGRMYAPGAVSGYVKDRWIDDNARREVSYQQFLLQLGATDRVLGMFIDRLKELGIYDKAIFVAVADHGASFQPHTHRRGEVSHPDFYDDVMSIPLFIKRPSGEGAGVNEVKAQTIDVVPTVLDLLGLHYDLTFDGTPLFKDGIQQRREQQLLVGRIPKKNSEDEAHRVKHELEGEVLSYTPTDNRTRTIVDWKYRIEGYAQPNPFNPYFLGPHANLLGKAVSEFPISATSAKYVFVSRSGKADPNRVNGVVRYDPKGGVCPCNLQGVIEGADVKASDEVAVAVNGVLQSFSRVISSDTTGGYFVFFVLDKAFKPGENRIEIFRVEESAETGIRLERMEPK